MLEELDLIETPNIKPRMKEKIVT